MKKSFELHIVERVALAALLIFVGMSTIILGLAMIKYHGGGEMSRQTSAVALFGIWFLTALGLFTSPVLHLLSPYRPRGNEVDEA